uniref:Uncharacterized protein n=1 Tax=Arundo donax TaxID=35708 RepID=A0A0A8XRW1_ARUDO
MVPMVLQLCHRRRGHVVVDHMEEPPLQCRLCHARATPLYSFRKLISIPIC